MPTSKPQAGMARKRQIFGARPVIDPVSAGWLTIDLAAQNQRRKDTVRSETAQPFRGSVITNIHVAAYTVRPTDLFHHWSVFLQLSTQESIKVDLIKSPIGIIQKSTSVTRDMPQLRILSSNAPFQQSITRL